MQKLIQFLSDFWAEALEIWTSGGWAMIAIAAIAFVMFSIGLHVAWKLLSKRYNSIPEETWRGWIEEPSQRTGPIGEIIEFTTGGHSLKEMGVLFDQVRKSELVPFERDLLVMRICVGAAPLVGLLGTVTGMLATFGALAAGSGGEKTMDLVASGISEALITTETGLVVALPGLFFQYLLVRKFEGYKAFLAHMEAVCAQAFYRRRTLRGLAA
jgi:biopolymer transport protein ExbB